MNKYFVFLLLFCLACRQAAAPKINFSVNKDKGTVNFVGLAPAIIGELKRNTGDTSGIYAILPVCRMPGDTSLKNYQQAIKGFYDFSNDTIRFTPDTPFAKNQVYFIRYYKHDEGISLLDMIKGSKKPGTVNYTELIFKY